MSTGLTDIKVDQSNLYREEAYTDFKATRIRHLIPVKPDGSPDESREAMYIGQTQLMSPNGAIPVQCLIEAKTLIEAMEKFPAAVETTVNEMIAEAKEIEREEASRIVIPGR